MTLPRFPDLDLNQNLWALLVSYAALGVAESKHLKGLSCLAFILVIVLSVSVAFTTAFYTWAYCVHKRVKARNELSGVIKVKIAGGVRKIPATVVKTEGARLKIYNGDKLVGDFPEGDVENWSFHME